MKTKEFHKEKIKEILDALRDSKGNNFLLCIGLFYLGVHLIDLHLLEKGCKDIENHGDRSNKLRQIDGKLFRVWKSLLSTSNDQRYESLTLKSHLVSLKEDVLEILSIITIPDEMKNQVMDVVNSICLEGCSKNTA